MEVLLSTRNYLIPLSESIKKENVKQLVKKTNLVAGSYKLLKGVTLKLDIQCRERLYFSFNFG